MSFRCCRNAACSAGNTSTTRCAAIWAWPVRRAAERWKAVKGAASRGDDPRKMTACPQQKQGAAMQPGISTITLGVDDLQAAVAFYRDGLGLPTKGIIASHVPHGEVAFFQLQPGLKLALWPRASLAKDAGLPVG